MTMKTYNKNICILLAIPVLALLLGACSETDDFFGVRNTDNRIKFRIVEENDWNATRTAAPLPNYDPIPVEGPDGKQLYVHTIVQRGINNGNAEAATRGIELTASTLSSFRVFGYRYDKGSELTTPNFFYNKPVTKQDDGSYTFAKAMYWPSTTDRFSFFAVAPEPTEGYVTTGYHTNPGGKGDEYIITGSYPNINFSEESHVGKPYFDYSCFKETDPTEQNDLVVAEAENVSAESGENEVTLKFNHVLTAVKFKIGDSNPTGFKITGIGFYGTPNKGRYTFGQGWTSAEINGREEWDGTPYYFYGTADYDNLNVSTATQGTNVLSDEQTFYFIPNTFQDDDEAYINISISSTEDDDMYGTMVIPLKGQTWEAGQTVTYLISTSALNYVKITEFKFVDHRSTEYSSYSGVDQRYRFVTQSPYTGNTRYSDDYHDVVWSVEEGDKIGVFVQKEDGSVSVSNHPYEYREGQWVTDEEIPYESDIFAVWAYYPYRSTLLGAPQVGDVIEIPNNYTYNYGPPTFWDGIKENWQIENDGTLAGMKNNILMTGFADYHNLSGYGFGKDYVHGLTQYATVTLGTKECVTKTNAKTYSYNGLTWNADEVTTCRASNLFPANNRPYEVEEGKYVYVVMPGRETTLSAGGDNYWSMTVTPSDGGWSSDYNSYIAITDRTITPEAGTPVAEDYVLRVGDSYYSDGTLAHNPLERTSATEINKVGVVVYVNDGSANGDILTEKNVAATGIGGHALVLGTLAMEHSGCLWATSEYGNTSLSSTVEEFGDNYGGYKRTKYILNQNPTLDTYPLFYYFSIDNRFMNNYPADKSTGWFIPTYGQLSRVMGLVGLASDYYGDCNKILGENVLSCINAIIGKGTNGHYNGIYSQSWGSGDSYWTTSEYSAALTQIHEWGFNTGSGGATYQTGANTSKSNPWSTHHMLARPMLAF